jgi:hypothetical protein
VIYSYFFLHLFAIRSVKEKKPTIYIYSLNYCSRLMYFAIFCKKKPTKYSCTVFCNSAPKDPRKPLRPGGLGGFGAMVSIVFADSPPLDLVRWTFCVWFCMFAQYSKIDNYCVFRVSMIKYRWFKKKLKIEGKEEA